MCFKNSIFHTIDIYIFLYIFIISLFVKDYDNVSEGENQDEDNLVQELKKSSSSRRSENSQCMLYTPSTATTCNALNQEFKISLKPTPMVVKESNNKVNQGGNKKQTSYESAVDLRRGQLISLPHANKMNKSDILSVDKSKFFNDCMHNLRVVLRSSVAPSSESTYSSGWTHCLTFVTLFGTDEFLTIQPKG